MRRRRSYKRFHQRSNKYQRKATFRIKSKIKLQTEIHGGLFYSGLDISSNDLTAPFLQDFSFIFAGKDKKTFWNATIITAQAQLWEKAHNAASKKAESEISEEDFERETGFKFIPSGKTTSDGKQTFKMIFPEPFEYPQFEGRTLKEQTTLLEKEILDNSPPAVFESFEVCHQYAHGTGLHIVVDAKTIGLKEVNDAIKKFFEIGCKTWTAETPVPKENLIYTTRKEAMEAQGAPGYLLGRQIII